MPKARECPNCGRIFNPKFGGKQMGTETVCSDCFVKESLKAKNQNTPNE